MKNNIFIFILIAIIGCISSYTFIGTPEQILVALGHVCTIELASFLYINYKVSNKQFSYSSLFIIVLFIFHFGQLILYTWFSDIYNHFRFLLLMEPYEALHGYRIMNLSFSGMCVGALLSESKKQRKITGYSIISVEDEKKWQKIAWKIIKYTFIVKCPLDLVTLFISITSSGESARAFVNSFPNIFLYYGKISLVGFALLLYVYRNNPFKQNRIFLFIEGYILLMMISGIRSENVGYVVVFAFIYLITKRDKIKPKMLVMYSILGFLVLSFIVGVGQFRSMTDKSISTLIEIIEISFTEHNLILGLLDNMGDTGYTALMVINEWLPRYGPSYGDAFYKGIFAVIPNLLPGIVDFGQITSESATPIKLQQAGVLSHDYENIGGSVIGELFLNFGIVCGVIYSLFFGYFLGWVGRNVRLCTYSNNLYRLILFIPIMLASIYWVRDYFGGGVREAVWGILFTYYFVKKNKLKYGN